MKYDLSNSSLDGIDVADARRRAGRADSDMFGPRRNDDLGADLMFAYRNDRTDRRVHADPSLRAVVDLAAQFRANSHEAHREQRRRPRVDELRISILFDATGVHHRDPVGHGERLILVVRHEHGGDPEVLQQAAEFDLHRLAQVPVERAERFVEQENVRLDRQGAGQGDALLLAARKRRHGAIPERPHLHEIERPRDLRRDRVPGQAPALQAEADVARDRQMREQRVVLEDDADVALMRRRARHVDARDRHLALVGRRQARDQPQQGRLAASRGAEQRHQGARRHGEVDRIENRRSAEAFRQTGHGDMGGRDFDLRQIWFQRSTHPPRSLAKKAQSGANKSLGSG